MEATALITRLTRLVHARDAAPPRVDRGAVISLRIAGRDEDAAIERLAQLVDPFHPSAEVRELLTLRAAQLDEDGNVVAREAATT